MNKLIILCCMFAASALYAQSDSVSFKLPALKITQLENGNKVIYDFENSPNWFFVNDSFLVADPKKYNYKVGINNIKRITIKSGADVLPVMVLFFAIGGLFGAGVPGGLHGGSVDSGERVVGALVGGGVLALIAGGIAALISHDNDYMLSKESFASKRKNLIEILRKNREK